MHGFEYERGQGKRDRDELSLHFWLVAEDLDGELSSQELCLGIFSFGRPVACLRRQPDRQVSQTVRETSVGRGDGVNEDCLGVADRPTSDDRIAADLLDPLCKAGTGSVWITQVSAVAGVGSPWTFLKRNVHSVCPLRSTVRSGARGRSWS